MMLPVELSVLIEILLKGVNVTNSKTQASKWASEIMKQLEAAGYKIVPVGRE